MISNLQVILAIGVFLLSYGLIISEKIHRTVVTLSGGVIIILFGVISQEKAVEAIDFNTIGLLMGMMLIVSITRRSGVFEYLAIKAAKIVQGKPAAIMVSLATVTAILSAFLDNVTTVLLIIPVTFAIAGKLKINPWPFLIAEVLASNIGGTATLIGDPPNIMIGSAARLGFVDFLVNLSPVVVIHLVTMCVLWLFYRRKLVLPPELRAEKIQLDENGQIKDRVLLIKSLLVLALTILGFLLHHYLNLESATIALAGASLLLLITREDPAYVLQAVEWPVIFFFIGLFILVGGLEQVGVIEAIARKSLQFTGGRLIATAVLILWLSAIASAFVDNIPFVVTMIPLIQDMGRLNHLPSLLPLWWALSLGACLGGNGAIIGASANVVVAGMAEKRGFLITFVDFMKVAFPLMILSIIISNIYLWLFYLR